MNNKIKVIMPALFAIMACTACGKKPCAEHVEGQLVSSTATCTKAGVATYHCYICDEIFEVPVEAKGHDFVYSNKEERHQCYNCGAKQYTVNVNGFEEDGVLTYKQKVIFNGGSSEIRTYSFKMKSIEYVEYDDAYIGYILKTEALTELKRGYDKPFVCYSIKEDEGEQYFETYNTFKYQYFFDYGEKLEGYQVGDEVEMQMVFDIRKDRDVKDFRKGFHSFTFDIVSDVTCIFESEYMLMEYNEYLAYNAQK